MLAACGGRFADREGGKARGRGNILVLGACRPEGEGGKEFLVEGFPPMISR